MRSQVHMPDFNKLWNSLYLFGPNPLSLSRSDYIFFWIGVGFVIIAIVAKIFVWLSEKNSPPRHLLSRFFHLFFTTGLLTLFWFGMRFENIPWLSTHFLELCFLLMGLVWFGFILKYLLFDFGPQVRAWRDEATKRKYLARK